jgi:hypothetical protein
MRRFLFAAAFAATGLMSTGAFAAPPAGARCAALAEAYDISTPSPASADTLVQAQALRREGGMLCSRDMEHAGARYLSSAIDVRAGKPGASASY